MRIVLFFCLLSTIGISAFAQSLSDEVDKIKQIKLLHSTRKDVKKILAGYKAQFDDVGHSETFSSTTMEIEVSYTAGICSDNLKQWNVKNGRVDFVDITFNDPVKFEGLNYNPADFRKERLIAKEKEAFVNYDKSKGIVFVVEAEKIIGLFFTPSTAHISLLCKNENAKILAEFLSRESYMSEPDSLPK